MDIITSTLIERRAAYTASRQHATEAAEALTLAEAELFLNSNYPGLGKNETERKAVFENLKRNDPAYRTAAQAVQIAERRKAADADALAAAEDARRAYENALRAAYLEAQFGVIVDPAKFNLDIQF